MRVGANERPVTAAVFCSNPNLSVEADFWYSLISGDDTANLKGATRVARLVENALVADGWPSGQLFGSQNDLRARYAVGRYVMDEAIRILEIRGACRLRRGPGGGLVVSNPDMDRVCLNLTVCILRNETLLSALAEAREALDAHMLDLADQHAILEAAADSQGAPPGHGVAAVRKSLIEHYTLRLKIAESLGNPAFRLFAQCLTNLSIGVVLRADLSSITDALADEIQRYESALVVAAGSDRPRRASLTAAKRAAQRIDEILVDRVGPHANLYDVISMPNSVEVPGDAPHAIRVARRISEGVISGKCARGSRLGSEWDLCEQYGIGQITLRQAVRILEEYEIAVTRPGRNNGIFSAHQFSFRPTIRMSHDCFAAEHLTGDAWWTVLRPIQTALVRLASKRASSADRLKIRRQLPGLDEITSPRAVNVYQRRLMYLVNVSAGSSILEVFWRMLCSYRYRAFAPVDGEWEPTYEAHSVLGREVLDTVAFTSSDASPQTYAMMSAALKDGFRDWVRNPFQ